MRPPPAAPRKRLLPRFLRPPPSPLRAPGIAEGGGYVHMVLVFQGDQPSNNESFSDSIMLDFKLPVREQG